MAKVESYVRLTGQHLIHCCTYDDAAPILTIQDGPADISITVPGRGEVTADDVAFGRLLAEAVARYVAELERLAATDRRRRPTRMSPGGPRDGTELMKAGRLELVPPAAPGFSPDMHERGDQVMRRVVTGEQVAQIYNPDPFARPVFRAPVYQTPAGLILLAAGPAAGPAGPAGRPPPAGRQRPGRWPRCLGQPRLGRPGRHGCLAPSSCWPRWRYFWPGSFARWVSRPARGKWRAWFYRRRWAAVMTIADLAPCTRAGSSCPCSARSPPPGTSTGSRSGWSPASPRPTSPSRPTTWPTGSAPCCAGSAPPSPGAVVLEFVRRDALAAVIPALPIPATPDLKALPVGRREDGLPWLVRLHGTHVLIAGATGAGKASLLWGLVRAMLPLMRDGLVRVLAADPKLMELAYGRVIFDTYGDYAADPAAIADMLDQAVADMQARAAPVRRTAARPHPDPRAPVHRGPGR